MNVLKKIWKFQKIFLNFWNYFKQFFWKKIQRNFSTFAILKNYFLEKITKFFNYLIFLKFFGGNFKNLSTSEIFWKFSSFFDLWNYFKIGKKFKIFQLNFQNNFFGNFTKFFTFQFFGKKIQKISAFQFISLFWNDFQQNLSTFKI